MNSFLSRSVITLHTFIIFLYIWVDNIDFTENEKQT